MLTRTPEQMALTETSRLCRQIVDLCRDAADQSDDPRVKAILATLVESHDRTRRAVDERLRALDDLPLTPDPDLELAKKLATRAKQFFVRDDDAVLIEERIEAEQNLLSHLTESLALDLSAPTRACLQDARETVRQALALLEEAQKKHPG